MTKGAAESAGRAVAGAFFEDARASAPAEVRTLYESFLATLNDPLSRDAFQRYVIENDQRLADALGVRGGAPPSGLLSSFKPTSIDITHWAMGTTFWITGKLDTKEIAVIIDSKVDENPTPRIRLGPKGTTEYGNVFDPASLQVLARFVEHRLETASEREARTLESAKKVLEGMCIVATDSARFPAPDSEYLKGFALARVSEYVNGGYGLTGVADGRQVTLNLEDAGGKLKAIWNRPPLTDKDILLLTAVLEDFVKHAKSDAYVSLRGDREWKTAERARTFAEAYRFDST